LRVNPPRLRPTKKLVIAASRLAQFGMAGAPAAAANSRATGVGQDCRRTSS
jgi:hypothetical protein